MKQLISSFAIALLALGEAPQIAPPPMREGLWSVHVVSTANPGNEVTVRDYQFCRSHAYDEALERSSNSMPTCKKTFDTLEGNKRTLEVACQSLGSSIVTRGEIIYSGDTASHNTEHSTISPAIRGKASLDAVSDFRYVGPCPVGMKPGDKRQNPSQ